MDRRVYDLKAGDIGGIKSINPFAKAILWAKKDEGPEKTTHVWRVVKDGKYPSDKNPAMIVEALIRGGVSEPASMTERYKNEYDRVWVARPINITDKEIGKIVGWTLGQVGKRYSMWMIVLHLLGLERKIASTVSAICSWLVAKGEAIIEKFWGLPAHTADPADIERFIAKHLGDTHIWIKPPPWTSK